MFQIELKVQNGWRGHKKKTQKYKKAPRVVLLLEQKVQFNITESFNMTFNFVLMAVLSFLVMFCRLSEGW